MKGKKAEKKPIPPSAPDNSGPRPPRPNPERRPPRPFGRVGGGGGIMAVPDPEEQALLPQAQRPQREGLYAGRQMTHRIDGRIITLIEPYENNGWVVDVERVGIMGRRREGREEILIHYIEQFYT